MITLLRIMGTFEKSEGLLLKNDVSPGAPCPPWSDPRFLQVQLFGARSSSASEWLTYHFLLKVDSLISCLDQELVRGGVKQIKIWFTPSLVYLCREVISSKTGSFFPWPAACWSAHWFSSARAPLVCCCTPPCLSLHTIRVLRRRTDE